MEDLGVPDGFRSSYGYGINDVAEVVGRMYPIDSADYHAFFYTDGSWTDLGFLGDDIKSHATDLNDLGQVVGWSYSGIIDGFHPFLWEDDATVALDVPPGFIYGLPLAINNAGSIVGYADHEVSNLRAVVWFQGTMYDLNDLVVSGGAWQELTIAEDINDAGQIVGLGENPDGDTHAFLLTPIVEAPCLGDANGDGTVDPLDTGFVLARFGCEVDAGDPDCDTADQNDDGVVDPLDVGYVAARFGTCE